MCGIFALLNNISADGQPIYSKDNVEKKFRNGNPRGPETTTMNYDFIDKNILLGFHRLAINGLDEISGQPMTIDNITLICNGEIIKADQEERFSKNKKKYWLVPLIITLVSSRALLIAKILSIFSGS